MQSSLPSNGGLYYTGYAMYRGLQFHAYTFTCLFSTRIQYGIHNAEVTSKCGTRLSVAEYGAGGANTIRSVSRIAQLCSNGAPPMTATRWGVSHPLAIGNVKASATQQRQPLRQADLSPQPGGSTSECGTAQQQPSTAQTTVVPAIIVLARI
jgi:hypothetical protein